MADPDRAAQMAAYMKTDEPFYGVMKNDRTPIHKALVERFPPTDHASYTALVSALWAEPHRESRYLAVSVARRWKAFHTLEQLDLYRRMVVEGAWWDFVDDIAANLVGPVVRQDPDAVWPIIDCYATSDDIWLRRTAILCQLKAKEETDTTRLLSYCRDMAHETEFFIRKAIGWALRQYAKTDPVLVTEFVRNHQYELSGLSFREATRHLPKEEL